MKKQEIQNRIDSYINKLYFNKSKYAKVRQYYNRERDNTDFAYLEQNYGIGNPFDIQFSSLLRLRIDILVGIFMSQEIKYSVNTLDPNMKKKEQQELIKLKGKLFDNFWEKIFYDNNVSVDEGMRILKEMEGKYFSDPFISSFRKAAQHIVNFYAKNSFFDIYTKVEKMALDLFLTGEFIYRFKPVKEKAYPDIINVLPELTFFRLAVGETDINESDSIVNIRYMTKRQVIEQFGHLMKTKQIKDFIKDQDIVSSDGDINYYSVVDDINHYEYSLNDVSSSGAERNFNDLYSGVLGTSIYSPYMQDRVKVYHVEFKYMEYEDEEGDMLDRTSLLYDLGLLKIKKKKVLREVLYEGYRISGSYYVGIGKVDDADRNPLDLNRVLYSYRGITFNEVYKNPTGVGYGLIDYQDMKDILLYIRNNLIASSGSNGSRTDFAAIPNFMGKDPFNRIAKFLSYKKQGLEIYDTSQKGGGNFQHFGDFSAMIDGPALQAIDYSINTIDVFADEISGISPQMRGQIEQRVAVNNVKTGIKMVSYANKRFYHAIDIGIEWLMIGLIIKTGKAFKEGFSGSYSEADTMITFEVLPEHINALNYIVSVEREDIDEMDREKLESMITAFVQGQVIDPESAIKASGTKSVQDLQKILTEGIKKQQEKNDVTQKLSQQLEQLNNAYKDVQETVKKQQSLIEKLEAAKDDIEREKLKLKKEELDMKRSIEEKKLENEKKKLEEIERRTELEKYQVDVMKGNAAEVRNLKLENNR